MRTSLFLLLVMVTGYAYAQYSPVIYDYEKSTFNDNQPLPAEEQLMLSGSASKQVNMVEFLIYKSSSKEEKKEKSLLYSASWKRPYGNEQGTFFMPVNYRLRGDQEYDFEIKYYRDLLDVEKDLLSKELFDILDAYIDLSCKLTDKKIEFTKSRQAILDDLNSIVINGMSLYRCRNDVYFKSYSDLIKLKLQQLDDVNLKDAQYLGEDEGKSIEKQRKLRSDLLGELKGLLHKELLQYLNNELLIVIDVVKIDDYPVEHSMNFIALNVGYSTTFFDFDFKDLNYGSAPYAGVSIPLGRSAFKSAFLSNLSISAGVMLLNMEDNEENTITGPFIKRPFYLGAGYRVFKFLRLNAGAVLLERELPEKNEIFVRPTVGLSLDINFWMGLGDRKK